MPAPVIILQLVVPPILLRWLGRTAWWAAGEGMSNQGQLLFHVVMTPAFLIAAFMLLYIYIRVQESKAMSPATAAVG